MRIGLSAVLFVFAFFAQSHRSSADVIVSLSPALQAVTPGSNATFDVFIRSTVANQQLTGMSLDLAAGLGDGSAGLFTAATTKFFGNPDPAVVWDFTDAGKAFYSFGGATAFTLGTSNELLGAVTLSTTGVPTGVYAVTFVTADFSASDQNLLPVTTSADPLASSASYVVAVPEPASLVVLGMSASVCGLLRARRKNNSLAT